MISAWKPVSPSALPKPSSPSGTKLELTLAFNITDITPGIKNFLWSICGNKGITARWRRGEAVSLYFLKINLIPEIKPNRSFNNGQLYFDFPLLSEKREGNANIFFHMF